MKSLHTYFKAASALLLSAMGLASCQDNVDAPADKVPVATETPNTTLMELKQLFWDDAKNYAKVIEDADNPERRFIIHGTVISSDEDGNVFKSLIIQDETAALAFSIDSYNLYLNYRRGQEIVLDVTGMDIGKYANLQQIGRKSFYENGNTDQVSFMALETFRSIAECNGMPKLADIDTLTVNNFGELSQTPEGLRYWQSRLVRFKNVYFEEAGKRKLSVWHSSSNEDQNTTIIDRNGSPMTVRTSGYSTFFNTTLPEGNLDIVGILSYYNDSWQIILIDGNGLIKVGERPGKKENPYTVAQAIEDEATGTTANGWLRGYIVGTLSPEVEDKVSSNSDIQWEAPFVISTSLVIADNAAERDYNKCIVVPLIPGTSLQTYGNLASNPGNLGKQILINGDLKKYLETWGLTGNNGSAENFEIEGVTVDDGSIADGDGSEASPFNVKQVIAKNPSSTTEAVATGVWVKGYIVGFMPTGGSSTLLSGTVFGVDGAAETNLVLGPTPDCTDATKCVGVQLPTYMRAALSLAKVPGNLGKELAVKGDIMKYCGGPGVKNLTENKLGDGGSTTPPTPPTPGGEETGEGTADSPYNVAKTIAVTSALAAGEESAEVYVTGIISRIKEISTSYGNASYYIVDEGQTDEFYVFRGYWLNGDKFTATDQLKEGAKVVIKGKLLNYMGNTPEFAQGNQIVSYEGSSTPEKPDTPDEPDPTPGTPGDAVTVPMSTFQGANGSDGKPTLLTEATYEGYTISFDKNGGATAPAYNLYNGEGTVRVYADNTVTVSGARIAKIVFSLNTATGEKRYTTFTPNTGSVGTQKAGDTEITWSGDAAKVTFTVGHDATIGSDGPTKRGQIHINGIEIFPAK